MLCSSLTKPSNYHKCWLSKILLFTDPDLFFPTKMDTMYVQYAHFITQTDLLKDICPSVPLYPHTVYNRIFLCFKQQKEAVNQISWIIHRAAQNQLSTAMCANTHLRE